MLSTLLKPTSGTAKVAGYDIVRERDRVRASIGIVFQEPALDIRLTGKENLVFHAMMYGLKKDVAEKMAEEVLKLVELEDKAETLVEKYSGGMKRRLEIARGFIHNPEVLFLDEPTLGLDAHTRRHIWEYIKDLNRKKGITIIVTTHYMEEADYLCDRVAIIDYGKIVAMDKPEKLKNSIGSDILTLNVDNGKRLFEELKKIEWVRDIRMYDGKIEIKVKNAEEKIVELISVLKSEKNVRSISVHKPSLEDVFLFYTGRELREEGLKNSKGMRRWRPR